MPARRNRSDKVGSLPNAKEAEVLKSCFQPENPLEDQFIVIDEEGDTVIYAGGYLTGWGQHARGLATKGYLRSLGDTFKLTEKGLLWRLENRTAEEVGKWYDEHSALETESEPVEMKVERRSS